MYFTGDPLSDWSVGARTDIRLRMAQEIVKHCALVSAVEDGEDSAGRQRVRLLPPEAVAERAMGIAERLVEIAEQRGYISATEIRGPRLAAKYHSLFNRDRYYGPREDAETEKLWGSLPEALGGGA